MPSWSFRLVNTVQVLITRQPTAHQQLCFSALALCNAQNCAPNLTAVNIVRAIFTITEQLSAMLSAWTLYNYIIFKSTIFWHPKMKLIQLIVENIILWFKTTHPQYTAAQPILMITCWPDNMSSSKPKSDLEVLAFMWKGWPSCDFTTLSVILIASYNAIVLTPKN